MIIMLNASSMIERASWKNLPWEGDSLLEYAFQKDIFEWDVVM